MNEHHKTEGDYQVKNMDFSVFEEPVELVVAVGKDQVDSESGHSDGLQDQELSEEALPATFFI